MKGMHRVVSIIAFLLSTNNIMIVVVAFLYVGASIIRHSTAFFHTITVRQPHGVVLSAKRNILNTPIRGESSSYGNTNNATIPTASHVAALLGVQPPDTVPARTWKRAFMILKYATPVLHLFDPIPNSSLNLYCMWWKALSGEDRSSPVYDGGLASALLPVSSRWVVRYGRRVFPRLHHANVELRTAYLDAAVEHFASMRKTSKIRLISFGAGYDTRSIKLKLRGVIDTAVEFDLPEVISSKRALLRSKRFKRRLHMTKVVGTDVSELFPTFVEIDLNDLDAVKAALQKEFANDETLDVYTVFLFEAVMIYLEDGVPAGLLEICRSMVNDNAPYSDRIGLVFADRLENVPGGDVTLGEQELRRLGWNLIDWCPKPGLARHMGRAVPMLPGGDEREETLAV